MIKTLGIFTSTIFIIIIGVLSLTYGGYTGCELLLGGVKVSELPRIVTIEDDDLIYIVRQGQPNISYAMTAKHLKEYIFKGDREWPFLQKN